MGIYRVLAGVRDFDSLVTRCEQQVQEWVHLVLPVVVLGDQGVVLVGRTIQAASC